MPIEFIPVDSRLIDDFLKPPADYCPCCQITYRCTREDTGAEFTIGRIFHFDEKTETQKIAWLYPKGNDFARKVCEKFEAERSS